VRPGESRRAYDGKLFDIVVERWNEHEREIVEHPGSVAIVAVDAGDRVVLVRQLREPARATLLELPAGSLEPDESPLDCARRELAEETGFHGGRWREGLRMWTSPGFVRELMHVFFAEGVEEGRPDTEPDEEIELVRIPVGDLPGHLGELEDAKTLVGVLLLLRSRGL